jgi:hypothetical protein
MGTCGDVRPIKNTELRLTGYFEPNHMGGSGYSGGLVEMANHKVFMEEFGDLRGVHSIHGDFDIRYKAPVSLPLGENQ